MFKIFIRFGDNHPHLKTGQRTAYFEDPNEIYVGKLSKTIYRKMTTDFFDWDYLICKPKSIQIKTIKKINNLCILDPYYDV